MSFDTVADNKAFADKFDFPYSLLCDTEKAMSIAYGAATDASAKYPARISYIVDDGKISWATEVTDIDKHVEEAVTRLTA